MSPLTQLLTNKWAQKKKNYEIKILEKIKDEKISVEYLLYFWVYICNIYACNFITFA